MKNMFKKPTFIILAIIGFLTLTAGHHFETELAKKYPQVDIGDIYTFESNTPNMTTFVMTSNPATKKNASDNFAENGVYQYHIGYDKAMKKGMTLTFMFKNGNIKVYVVNETEPTLGNFGKMIGEGPMNKTLNFDNGLKVWSGATKEPFFGNSGGISPFRVDAKKGKYNIEAFDIGQKGNGFSALLASTIVFEIPNKMLSETITYYGSTAIMEEGDDHWHQINRIGHVLFPHMYMLEENDNEKRNAGKPSTDVALRPIVAKTIAHYVSLSKMNPNPKAYGDSIAKIILPDVVSYKIGTKANYGMKIRNGRRLTDDAMNVAMGLWLGSKTPIDDKVHIVEDNYINDFPYVKPVDDAYINATNKMMNVTAKTSFGYEKEKKAVTEDSTKMENQDDSSSSSPSIIYWLLGGLALLAILYFYLKRKTNN